MSREKKQKPGEIALPPRSPSGGWPKTPKTPVTGNMDHRRRSSLGITKLVPLGYQRTPIMYAYPYFKQFPAKPQWFPHAASNEEYSYFSDHQHGQPDFHHPSEMLHPHPDPDKQQPWARECTAQYAKVIAQRNDHVNKVMNAKPGEVHQPAHGPHAFLFGARFGIPSAFPVSPQQTRNKSRTGSVSSKTSDKSNAHSPIQRHPGHSPTKSLPGTLDLDYGVELVDGASPELGYEAASYGLADGIYKVLRNVYRKDDPAIRWFYSTFLWEHYRKDTHLQPPANQLEHHKGWDKWTPYAFHTQNQAGISEILLQLEVTRIDHPQDSYALTCMMDADLPGLTSEQLPHYGYLLTIDEQAADDDLLSGLADEGFKIPVGGYPTDILLGLQEDEDRPSTPKKTKQPQRRPTLMVPNWDTPLTRPLTDQDKKFEGRRAPKPVDGGRITHRPEPNMQMKGAKKMTGHVFFLDFIPSDWRLQSSALVEHMHAYIHNEGEGPRPPSGLVAGARSRNIPSLVVHPTKPFHEDSLTEMSPDKKWQWKIRMQAKKALHEQHYAGLHPDLDDGHIMKLSQQNEDQQALSQYRYQREVVWRRQMHHMQAGKPGDVDGFSVTDLTPQELKTYNALLMEREKKWQAGRKG